MKEIQKREKASRMNGGNGTGEVNAAAVLRELFELLEDYGPAWYTQEAHERASAALMQCMR